MTLTMRLDPGHASIHSLCMDATLGILVDQEEPEGTSGLSRPAFIHLFKLGHQPGASNSQLARKSFSIEEGAQIYVLSFFPDLKSYR